MRALTIAEAIGEGVISVPETLLDGIKRTAEGWEFWDKEQEVKIDEQNKRAYRALKQLYKYSVKERKSVLAKAIKIILWHFYNRLPASEREKVINWAAKKGVVGGTKIATSAILSLKVSDYVAEKIIATTVFKKIYRFMIKKTVSAEFTLLSIQGLLYKAGAASDRLRKNILLFIWK